MDGKQFFTSLTLILIFLTSFDCNEKEDIPLVMKISGVVPNVIPVAPNDYLDMSYPRSLDVMPGRVLTTRQTDHIPYAYWPVQPNTYYTFSMTKPDFYNGGSNYTGFNHFLVVNINGCQLHAGETIVDYVGVLPPDDKKFHLYLALVYAQPDKIKWNEKFIDELTLDGRENFKIHEFAKKYNLGNPTSGTFFLTQYDRHVPNIQRRVKGEDITEEVDYEDSSASESDCYKRL